MQVLVTGGAGFLGRYIVDLLLERGYRVRIFQRSDAPDLAQRGVEIVRGSLSDVDSVQRAVMGCDAVFHVAAKAGVWGRRADYFKVNLEGTRAVIDACRTSGVKWLIYTSTPSVVFNGDSFRGEDEELPYGHDWLCHYAESKAEAEAVALAANAVGGLQVCALRPHLIWGVGDPHLLPRVMERARAGKLRIVGDGKNRVDITHVRNAAAAHIAALDALGRGKAGGRAFFISQGEPVVLWEWINELLSRVGVPRVEGKIAYPVARRIGSILERAWSLFRIQGEPPMTRFVATELAKDHWYSIEAARVELGYEPERFSTEAGLEEFVAVYLKKRK